MKRRPGFEEVWSTRFEEMDDAGVFVCGLDETSGRQRRDRFFMGGFVAPARDWFDNLAPVWQRRVLDGPPKIPYLHMTEIRSPRWREEYGLSKIAANERVNAAIELIEQATNLFPVGMGVDGGDFCDSFSGMRVVHPDGGNVPLDPDYVCFLGYSYLVLSYIGRTYINAEKVDFVVERNGRVTKYIEAFHSGLAQSLAALGRLDLSKLVGDVIPAGKEHALLQAADVLCWHTARPRGTMDQLDVLRYSRLARKIGIQEKLDSNYLKEVATALTGP